MIIGYDELNGFDPSVGDRIISRRDYLVGTLVKKGEMEEAGKWYIDWESGVDGKKIGALLELEEVLIKGYRIATNDEEIKKLVKEEAEAQKENSEDQRKTEVVENEEDVIKKLMDKDGFITNKSWREERRLFDSLKAGRELKKLVEDGKLRSEGQRKGMKYYACES